MTSSFVHNDPKTSAMLFLALLAIAAQTSDDWSAYGKDPGGLRFVSQTRITPANVSNLIPAWTFHTGDVSDGVNKPFSAFECTPLFVQDHIFVVSPFNKIFCLDPDSGKPRWKFDPKIATSKSESEEAFACRGIAYWHGPTAQSARLFVATHDARLIVVSAKTGFKVSTFGDQGEIDLKSGLVKQFGASYTETSAPTIVGDLLIVGSSIGDNHAVDMPSGLVRAYDCRTGKLRWSWDPLQKRLSPKGVAIGAANVWATISADPDRDMIFLPTTSPSPDFIGSERPGNDEDADSIVALRASTGERLWAFQLVHHNLWDYDVPAQPIVTDISGRRAVVAMSKMGFVYVLDEATGKPMLPIEEKPVPQSDVPGEKSSPTQPFPVLPPPLLSDKLEPWSITDAGKQLLAKKLQGARQEGIFTPPSVQGSVVFPGHLGGCNWSGGSVDPVHSTLFVNTNSIASLVYLIPRSQYESAKTALPGHEFGDQLGTDYAMRREWFFVPGNIPGNKPPWGQLHSVDLATGKINWSVPLGWMPQYREIPEAQKWGSPNLGGSTCTSTGLVFISATTDPTIHAFDAATGKVLWQHVLPAGGQAAPILIRSSKTGTEYLIQCAGGHHGLGSPEGDSVVAFRLNQ